MGKHHEGLIPRSDPSARLPKERCYLRRSSTRLALRRPDDEDPLSTERLSAPLSLAAGKATPTAEHHFVAEV
jgi:hypothetical protein